MQLHNYLSCSLLLLLVCSLHSPTVAADARGNKWCSENPVTVDFDMENIPEPKERERSYYYDFLYSTFGLQASESLDFPRNLRKIVRRPKQAYNVNCLGEVPDSSWYTNRNTKLALSLEEIGRGPNRGTGPAPGVWKVVQGKTEGITPGFLIRDSRGDIYQLKFDPPEYPEMATAAEVIASKLYYAAGFNVKENYLVVFERGRLGLDEKAKMKNRYGRSRPMRDEDLNEILSRVARRADGTYRAVAGKFLEGIAKGPFSFEGVRKDDPNDWIPHEHRRELRGLRVFCSWVNENDFREGNTLDMYVEEGGARFLKHYIIDLGSSLGSDTIHPNIDRIGNEYALDAGEITKSLFSLGLYRRPWKGSSKKIVYPSVGFLEADIFHPGRWKANYPVLPFENMTLQDAFWGARLVLSFTDEQIRAAVETGEFSDPRAKEFLAKVLILRRDKIGQYWLSRVNPLDNFAVVGSREGRPRLIFENLEIGRGFLPGEQRSYEYIIREEFSSKIILPRQRTTSTSIDLAPLLPPSGITEKQAVPPELTPGVRVYRIAIRSAGQGRHQSKDVEVYIAYLSQEQKLKIVGISRND